MIGCLVADVKDVTELAPLLFVPQLLFAGTVISYPFSSWGWLTAPYLLVFTWRLVLFMFLFFFFFYLPTSHPLKMMKCYSIHIGFFIRTSLIPVFLRWAQYLCAIKYAINLVLLTEFNPTNKSCQGDAGMNCKFVLINNDIRVEDTYIYILVIFALFIVFRITGAAILIKKARRFY